ncbi:MAG: SEL1-like repeat protein [Pseudomonadota bacterium]
MAYADTQIEAPEADLKSDAAPEEFYRLGLIYSTGMGVAADLVAAHKWFNLAALRGSQDAKACRKDMADQMTTEEVRAALKAAREWMLKAN